MSVLLCVSGDLEVQIVEHLAEMEPPVPVARRCADLIELVASAQAGIGSIAIVDDVDVTTAAELHSRGVQIIGVLQRMDPGAARHVGCDVVASPFADDVAACLLSLEEHRAIASEGASGGLADVTADGAHSGDSSGGVPATPTPEAVVAVERSAWVLPPVHAHAPGERMPNDSMQGRVIAVWGSAGSPGRSTVARDVAHALATQVSTLLIDADVRSPSMAQLLGLDQETSSIVAVARAINAGEQDPAAIGRACTRVAGVDFLSGLNTGKRWREIPRPVAERLWRIARHRWEYVVVDCAAQSEVPGYGFEMERDGVTLSLLDEADEVMIVGQAGPLGVRRLIAQLEHARDLGVEDPHVVVTKLGRRQLHTLSETAAILEEVGVDRFFGVRDDREYLTQAVNRGLALQELAPTCAAARDIAGIAEMLLGRDIPPLDVGRWRVARFAATGILSRVRRIRAGRWRREPEASAGFGATQTGRETTVVVEDDCSVDANERAGQAEPAAVRAVGRGVDFGVLDDETKASEGRGVCKPAEYEDGRGASGERNVGRHRRVD